MVLRNSRYIFKLTASAALYLFMITAAIFSQQPEIGDPVVGGIPQEVEDDFIPEPDNYRIRTWIEDLEIPWSLVFLSEKRALVTERPGRVRIIKEGVLREDPYKIIEDAVHIGEGGLMGIEKHPEYPEENYIYLMYTYRDGDLYNRVDRYVDTEDTLEYDRTIVRNIPGHRVHNGGRIAFGPDGLLYICTGDIWQAELAQDEESLAGKILRYTPDGDIPEDNPFDDSPVYSLGHRNPQGLAWHGETGSLFSSEHGPSGEFGGLQGKDIVNLIKKGGNYGWPLVLGSAGIDPYIDPLIMWKTATPPSGMAFLNGNLYVATLRSQSLVRINFNIEDGIYKPGRIDRLFAQGDFSGAYGRLRDVVVGPDGALYVLTSNRDGRGSPAENDDRILKLNLR